MKLQVMYHPEERDTHVEVVPEHFAEVVITALEISFTLSESQAQDLQDKIRRTLHELTRYREENAYNHNPSKR